jgi:CBS domain-containing protein
MKARDIMKRYPFLVTPDDLVASAAEVMHYDTDACVPVVLDREHPVLVGIITARDIAARCVARRHLPGCLTRDHMTPMPLHTVSPDDDVVVAWTKMEGADVRRIPVITDKGELLGMLREADVVERLRPRVFVDPRPVHRRRRRHAKSSAPAGRHRETPA